MKHTDIDLGKGFNPWGEHRKLKPSDTLNRVADEALILNAVAEQQPVPCWRLFRELVNDDSIYGKVRRQELMVISTRLIKEGKLQRARSHQVLADAGYRESPGLKSCLVLGPSYVQPMPDIQDSIREDLSGTLRDVDRFSSVAQKRGSVPQGGSSRTRL